MRLMSLALVLALVAGAAATSWAEPTTAKPKVERVLMKTSMGDIELELWPDVAPETVRVFLGLANGKGTFTDVRNASNKVTISKPFYDGLQFHRVIKGFMIQGGCPQGSGMGNPGFMFKDEINAKALGLDKMKAFTNGRPHQWMGIRNQMEFQQKILVPMLREMKIPVTDQNAINARQKEIMAKINAMTLKDAYELMGYQYDDKLPSKKPVKGVLALANAGPNTNGSQFFINLGDTPHLTGKHTVFGKVSKGMDIIEKIGNVKTAGANKPVTPIKIISIRSMP